MHLKIKRFHTEDGEYLIKGVSFDLHKWTRCVIK